MEEIDKIYKELVESMVAKLWEIRVLENDTDGGRLSTDETAEIDNDIAYAEANFLGKTTESDRHIELCDPHGIDAKEAINVLSSRLQNVFDSLY
jgi:hypothetical protein